MKLCPKVFMYMRTKTLGLVLVVTQALACAKPAPGETVCDELSYAGATAKRCTHVDLPNDGKPAPQGNGPSASFSAMPSGGDSTTPNSSIELWGGQTPTPDLLGASCDLAFSDAIFGQFLGSTSASLSSSGDITFEEGTVWLSIPEDQLGLGLELVLTCPLGKDIGTGEPIVWTAKHNVVLRPGEVENLALNSFEGSAPPAAGFY